jgi:hypothetical protein
MQKKCENHQKWLGVTGIGRKKWMWSHSQKQQHWSKQKNGKHFCKWERKLSETRTNKHKRGGGAAAESFNLKTLHQNRLQNLLTNLMVEWHSPAPMSVDHYD